MDTNFSPLTSFGQSSSFRAFEPAVTPLTSDFTIPLSDYQWNKIVELQLPNGKKVFN
jgi:hypothetical protein